MIDLPQPEVEGSRVWREPGRSFELGLRTFQIPLRLQRASELFVRFGILRRDLHGVLELLRTGYGITVVRKQHPEIQKWLRIRPCIPLPVNRCLKGGLCLVRMPQTLLR